MNRLVVGWWRSRRLATGGDGSGRSQRVGTGGDDPWAGDGAQTRHASCVRMQIARCRPSHTVGEFNASDDQ
eukprot:150550-Prymnesium_polylepis.1